MYAPLTASSHAQSFSEAERKPEAMQVLYKRCCGLDVHKKTVVACVLITSADGGSLQADAHCCDEDRRAASLSGLASHSAGQTFGPREYGIYWRPVFNLLEAGHTIILVNAQHMNRYEWRLCSHENEVANW